MTSEAKLKAQMKAAIAKKKQAAVMASDDNPPKASPKIAAPQDDSPTEPPEREVAPPVKPGKKNLIQAISSEADLIRTFFGRPIRIAVLQKEVYFAVPDVLEMADNLDKQTKYEELLSDPSVKKLITPLVKVILFPGPNSGNEPLDAAKVDDLNTIIHELELKFSGPIEKWLVETSDSLMILVG